MEIQPLHTKVEKTISAMIGEIVLESPNGFPRGESNLYTLSQSGTIIWKAEKPVPDALFTRVKLNEDGNTLSAYTTSGHACDLDLKTGKLVSQTKIQ